MKSDQSRNLTPVACLASERGIPLGRILGSNEGRTIGFGSYPRKEIREASGLPVFDGSEGHVLTIAPTGAGKGRNIIIPTLLTYQGPVIVIDPKGENVRVTARWRQAHGHNIIVIDPFDTLRDELSPLEYNAIGSLNPLDCLDSSSPDFEADCFMVTKQITGNQMSLQDRFWDQNCEDFMTRLIAYICRYLTPDRRNLATLIGYLSDPDLAYNLAVILDTTEAGKDTFICQGFQNFLGHEREKVQSSIRSTAMQHLTAFSGEQIASATNRSSFDLQGITRGDAITIYLVIPPHKLEAYGKLLRLWVALLSTLITRRKYAPPVPTLFILDELAQLGPFPLLKPLVTLMRGYGVRAMLFLQDVSQLKGLFPNDYATIINNCTTLATFGHSSFAMSREIADLLGDVDADTLFSMSQDNLCVRRAGIKSSLLSRIDYLNDPLCANRFDPNPLASMGY